MNKPLLWGYFFADPTRPSWKRPASAAGQGYQQVGIYDSKPEADTPALWWLHIEKVEAHGRHPARTQPGVLPFAEEQQLESYDGMDVGPA
jgi:hypothetical protein